MDKIREWFLFLLHSLNFPQAFDGIKLCKQEVVIYSALHYPSESLEQVKISAEFQQ